MDVTLEALSSAEIASWRTAQRAAYVADRIRAGDTPEAAEKNASATSDRFFPDGRPLDGHRVLGISDGPERVGVLWIGPHPDALPGVGWVWSIEIDPSRRRRGYGRAAMLAAEAQARASGYTTLALNVFGFNTAARDLYEGLGFEATAIQMSKAL